MIDSELPFDIEESLRRSEALVNGQRPLTNLNFYLFGLDIIRSHCAETGANMRRLTRVDVGNSITLIHGLSNRIRNGWYVHFQIPLTPMERVIEVHGRLEAFRSFRTYWGEWRTHQERLDSQSELICVSLDSGYKRQIITQIWDAYMLSS